MPETPKMQETFLDEIIENGGDATIFLMTGTRLISHIIGYDKFNILMEDTDGNKQLVVKENTATIVQGAQQPQKPAPKPKPTKNTLSLSKKK